MSEQFATFATTVDHKINTNKGMPSNYGENVTYYRKK